MSILSSQSRRYFFALACLGSCLSSGAFAAGTPIVWGNPAMTTVPAGLSNRVVAIACGMYHTLALRDNGTLVAWGDNSAGQLSVPPGLANVKAIAAGGNHCIAVRSNGTVVAWGQSDAGQTNVPAWAIGVKQAAAGDFHSLVLFDGGTVNGWGANTYGQLNIPALSGVSAITAGAFHNLALRNNGTVVAWGYDPLDGRTVVPILGASAVAIAAGEDFSLALLQTTAVVLWGNNHLNTLLPPFASGATAIAAGADHILAIRNGRVVAWGENTSSQTDVPTGLSNVVAIAAGYSHSAALFLERPRILVQPENQIVMLNDPASFSVTAAGSTPLRYQWRKDSVNIANATNATYNISSAQTNNAGAYSVVVSNAVGAVTSATATLVVNVRPFIVEDPQSQDVLVGSTVTFQVTAGGTKPLSYQWRKDSVAVTPWNAGSTYTILQAQANHQGRYTAAVSNSFGVAISLPALLTVNNLPAFTLHPQSQSVIVGSPVTFTAAATGATGYQWQKDGGILPGANASAYTINNAQLLDAGIYAVLATNAFGSTQSAPATLTVSAPAAPSTNIVLWGQRSLLVGSDYLDVTPPGGLDDTIAVDAGTLHHLVLKRDGTVDGWGGNNFLQAKPLFPVNQASAIAAGGYHSLALLQSSRVLAWGLNDHGQTNVPPGLANVIAIAAGGSHSLALTATGRVVAWGWSNQGQTNVPPGVTNVIAIAAGLEHSLALLANGTVTNWGDNTYNQGRIPRDLSNVIAIAAGDYHNLALKRDGTVVAWGRNDPEALQTNVPPGLCNVIAIAAGANHSLALLADGTVRCWGSDNYYQSTPPPDLKGVFAIAAGGARNLALRRNPVRLLDPQPIGGGYRLLFGHADGTPIPPDRSPRIEVYASTNLNLPWSNWITLGAGSATTNNLWSVPDPVTTLPRRFYRLIERP